MKKIQIKVSALVAATLSGVIALLGFSGCKAKKNVTEGDGPIQINRPIKLMYGVPANTYKVMGEITGPDDKPVEGATVDISTVDGEPLESVRSGYDGRYFTNYMRDDSKLKVVVRPNDDTLDADSTEVSPENLIEDPGIEVNFKLKKK